MKCSLLIIIYVFNFCGWPTPRTYFNNSHFPNYGSSVILNSCVKFLAVIQKERNAQKMQSVTILCILRGDFHMSTNLQMDINGPKILQCWDKFGGNMLLNLVYAPVHCSQNCTCPNFKATLSSIRQSFGIIFVCQRLVCVDIHCVLVFEHWMPVGETYEVQTSCLLTRNFDATLTW